MTRSKKAAFNLTASFLHESVALVCGLITPRLILYAFGSTYNGVISSVTQFMTLITFLTLGIGGAIRVELYRSLAKGDKVETAGFINATSRYMRKVGLAILVYAGILMIIYPYISTNDLTHAECAIIVGIVSFGSFMQYFFGTANAALLVADQKLYIKTITNTIMIIVNTLVVALLIHLGFNVFIVKGASALVFACTPVIMALYVKHHYKLDPKIPPKHDALKGRNSVAVHSIANIVHEHTDTLLLTIFMDAKSISVYAVYYLVAGKIKSVIMEVTAGIEAAFGNMFAKNEMDLLRQHFRLFEYVMSSAVVVIFSCLGLLLLPFVELYTRGVTDINYILPVFAALITIAEGFFCIRQPYRTLVHAAGKYKETQKAAVGEAVINLGVSIVLVQFLGLNGVVIGTMAANIYRTACYSWYVSRHLLDRSYWMVIKRVVWTVLCTVFIILLIRPVIEKIMIEGWSGWFVKGLVSFCLASVCTLILSMIFYRRDLQGSIRMFRSRLLRKQG